MGFIYKFNGKSFNIRIHWKFFNKLLHWKEFFFFIGIQWKWFYYRNTLDSFFFHRSTFQRVLGEEYFGKGSTVRIHGKGFYYKNAKERILLYKCIRKGFTIGTH